MAKRRLLGVGPGVGSPPPDGREAFEQIPLTPEDLVYPQEGDHVSQGLPHFHFLHPQADAIRRYLEKRPGIVVTSDVLLVLRHDGRTSGPDVAVIEDLFDTSEIESAVNLREVGGRLSTRLGDVGSGSGVPLRERPGFGAEALAREGVGAEDDRRLEIAAGVGSHLDRAHRPGDRGVVGGGDEAAGRGDPLAALDALPRLDDGPGRGADVLRQRHHILVDEGHALDRQLGCRPRLRAGDLTVDFPPGCFPPARPFVPADAGLPSAARGRPGHLGRCRRRWPPRDLRHYKAVVSQHLLGGGPFAVRRPAAKAGDSRSLVGT